MHDVTYSAAQWQEICRRILAAWGTPEDITGCVAHSLCLLYTSPSPRD